MIVLLLIILLRESQRRLSAHVPLRLHLLVKHMLVVLALLLVKLVVVVKALHLLLFWTLRVPLGTFGFFDLLKIATLR